MIKGQALVGELSNIAGDMGGLLPYKYEAVNVPAAPSSLLSGLLAFYPMHETSGSRLDVAGSGHNLTVVGSIGSTAGLIGNAAYFSGGASTLLYGSGLIPAPPFTVSVFFLLDAAQAGLTNYFWTQGSGTSPVQYASHGTAGRNHALFFGLSGSSAITSTYVEDVSWHNVVVSLDTSGNAKLFTDAVFVAAASGVAFGISGGAFTSFGSTPDGLTNYTGLIQLCGIWNRVLADGSPLI